MTDIQLYGRVFLASKIETLTGLHIGGSGSGLEIGDVDNEVIRNPLSKRPYIPGSSLRRKMRSQTEKVLGLPQNQRIGQVTIHVCQTEEAYKAGNGCPVCHIFGVPAQDYTGPTRLIVRDAELTDESAEELDRANTDLRYAELKTEVAIDRVTSAASPRTIERIPAGAVFGPAGLVYGIYGQTDYDLFKVVVDALQLVEDDYLGGSGSRGSGKVRFADIEIYARAQEDYASRIPFKEFANMQEVADAFDELRQWLASTIPTE